MDTTEKIDPAEMAMHELRSALVQIGKLAADGKLSNRLTHELGDMAADAVAAWKIAVAAMVERWPMDVWPKPKP